MAPPIIDTSNIGHKYYPIYAPFSVTYTPFCVKHQISEFYHTLFSFRYPPTTSMNFARSSHWAICALFGKVYHLTRGSTFHTGAIVLSAASS